MPLSHYNRFITLPIIIFLIVVMLPFNGFAEESRATLPEVLSLRDKAVSLLEKNGLESARTEISKKDGEFIDRDLYVTILNMDGVMMAHGTIPALNGKNLMNYSDIDGKLYIKEAIESGKANGEGFVTYKFSDPLTKKVSYKDMYFKIAVHGNDKYLVSVGHYKKQ
ncbi:putative Chemotaxis protein [Azospirillaceae bacterium]